MTRPELERQLRTVHPFRESSRRRQRALTRTRRALRTVIGVMFGVGLAAMLAAVHLVSQDEPASVGGQTATWGHTHGNSVDGVAGPPESSLFPSPQHPYNPHYDPRARSAGRWRRAYFGR